MVFGWLLHSDLKYVIIFTVKKPIAVLTLDDQAANPVAMSKDVAAVV